MERSIAKRELRKLVKSKLSLIKEEELVRESRNVLDAIKSIPEFNNATKIALYMNMPKQEARTDAIIKDCFNKNMKIFLPKCVYDRDVGRKKNHLKMLEMASYDEVLNLIPQGKYNLLEPVTGNDLFEYHEGLDIIVVPGVAFTKNGKRLGHGAGFYDEFLTTHCEKFGKSPFIIGIGMREQLVVDIPTESHDWNLDCIIINDTIYRVS